jgi:pheromone a factor receptor
MAWAGLGCLNAFINSVVWNNTTENKAPVWCDICSCTSSSLPSQFADRAFLLLLVYTASRFIVGVGVGLPAATLVISHRLYKIASRTVTFSTRAEKRRAIFIDLAIGLGIPILEMALRESLCLAGFPSSI